MAVKQIPPKYPNESYDDYDARLKSLGITSQDFEDSWMAELGAKPSTAYVSMAFLPMSERTPSLFD